jgi:hypothetical protein
VTAEEAAILAVTQVGRRGCCCAVIVEMYRNDEPDGPEWVADLTHLEWCPYWRSTLERRVAWVPE